MTKALLMFAVGLLALFGFWLFLNPGTFQGDEKPGKFFMKKLVRFEPVPAVSSDPLADSGNILYVLGGSQRSLESRFRKAAALYRDGAAKKVWIMSRKGITEYSPSLGRNLTNDEWAVGKLVEFGVPKADIEAVFITESFWGTYNEATAISDLVLKRGYNHLILVTSPHHAERVRNSFEKFLRHHDVQMDIYVSDDRVKQSDLMLEYLKRIIYNSILLPFFTIAAA